MPKPSKPVCVVGRVFKVRICQDDWKVHLIPNETLKEEAGGEVWGMTDRLRLQIMLRNDIMEKQILSTFFHEWVHAVLTSNQGTPESHNGAVNEELAANLIGQEMTHLLSQLPLILKEIKNDKKVH
jgi:hypothetical protein